MFYEIVGSNDRHFLQSQINFHMDRELILYVNIIYFKPKTNSNNFKICLQY